MTTIEWQQGQHALAAGPMDEAHQEFVMLTNLLAAADDDDEARCLQQLIAHCEAHFAQEELWMREFRMPMAENHTRDHEGVISLLQSALSDVRRGQAGAGRELVESLGEWFHRHGETMDAALAFQMQIRSRGTPANGISSVG
ncbi:bacteriohemerythrin [Uliginosibacterium paludis]|uniref:Hemerythrin domain-containing protein n=1 Tax=Uliginosibacterium paludis TaxID=1615952 RepID=A0ABV2CW43_9RHOO